MGKIGAARAAPISCRFKRFPLALSGRVGQFARLVDAPRDGPLSRAYLSSAHAFCPPDRSRRGDRVQTVDPPSILLPHGSRRGRRHRDPGARRGRRADRLCRGDRRLRLRRRRRCRGGHATLPRGGASAAARGAAAAGSDRAGPPCGRRGRGPGAPDGHVHRCGPPDRDPGGRVRRGRARGAGLSRLRLPAGPRGGASQHQRRVGARHEDERHRVPAGQHLPDASPSTRARWPPCVSTSRVPTSAFSISPARSPTTTDACTPGSGSRRSRSATFTTTRRSSRTA